MTAITQREIDLIRDSFGGVLTKSDAAGRLFYDELFRIAPELEPMFTRPIGMQGKKLIDTIALAVYALRSPGGPATVLGALGRSHAARYNVRADNFKPVGQALMRTLEQCLGPQFTSETRLAWLHFYELMAGIMIEAGQGAAEPQANA